MHYFPFYSGSFSHLCNTLENNLKIRSCLVHVVCLTKGLVSVTHDKLHVRNDAMPQKKREKDKDQIMESSEEVMNGGCLQ